MTSYDVVHDKRLHLIVVRRDLTGFQHVHPRLDPGTGEWTTDVRLTPGVWRVIADFTPAGGEPLTLGQDLSVPGDFAPEGLGPERRTAEVDGYTVTLAGDLAAGTEARLVLTVTRGGRPVTDLQPYLGAYGHLVALRAGDLGYLHVHPDGEPGDVPAGPDVVFHAEVPSTGSYRLFLDFRHGGIVHTAAFTVHVTDGSAGESQERRPAMATDVELAIGGMTCASCANRIEKQAQQAGRRHRHRQLRHREGEGQLPRDGVAPRT